MKMLRNFKGNLSHPVRINYQRFAMFILCLVAAFITGENLKGQGMYISGPTLLCSSANYTLENFPGGCATITWSTEGHVQLNSGQGSTTANFTINGNGNGNIKADVYECGTHTYKNLYIFSGPPIIDYISAETGEYGYAGNSYSFAAWPYYVLSASEVTWYTYPYANVWYNEQYYGIIYFENTGNYYISADATNTCGTSALGYLENPSVWIIY